VDDIVLMSNRSWSCESEINWKDGLMDDNLTVDDCALSVIGDVFEVEIDMALVEL
jgi:hypothetical protein